MSDNQNDIELNVMDKFRQARSTLFEHVGFTPDWVMCPISDEQHMYWDVRDGMVLYAETEEDFHNQSGRFYRDHLYTQRFYDQWVYEGEDVTMVMCDPRVDGVQWFRVFNNEFRIRE